ncbi:hypothetical protein ESCO_002078 [Escovopsis weberi]|uniref:Alginate lyase domain-containing protein n=1 Tax=Escovopsis weberi TaxID=150374 RepID=A0A0M8N834_ESCWE|nr:hypothetical protein ESCO_002078 [Escovopsis weberi]
MLVPLTALVAAGLAAGLPGHSNPRPSFQAPNTVVIPGERLLAAKQSLQSPHSPLHGALGHLTAQADSWLGQGPWTVTSKTSAPPNGTVHDYASQAPYWWPNPDTADGCPYIQKDGVRNPDVDKYQDRIAVGKMFNSSYVLALAWYYTGRDEYALHAADILNTWFLDPDTGMNPNLDHAQIIPCANDGRSIGIIDFSQEYTNVLDAAAILASGGPRGASAPGWTPARNAAFRAWNARFLDWLANSPFGVQEAAAANNHGTFANMQIAALALFTGDTRLAARYAALGTQFIDSQVAPDGSLPQEIARTRSFHYSNFDLGALLRWALVAQKVGVDLFGHVGPEGQTLLQAARFVIPAAVGGQGAWDFPELEFTQYAATDNVRAAAAAGLQEARAVLGELAAPPGGDIFDLRPAPQQLDSIVTL